MSERLIHFTPAIISLAFLIGGPLFIGTAWVSLLTKILIFALMAMSLDIAFGYTGLWSFGHAALFGVAAYTNGILIKHYGISSFWLAAPSGVLNGDHCLGCLWFNSTPSVRHILPVNYFCFGTGDL